MPTSQYGNINLKNNISDEKTEFSENIMLSSPSNFNISSTSEFGEQKFNQNRSQSSDFVNINENEIVIDNNNDSNNNKNYIDENEKYEMKVMQVKKIRIFMNMNVSYGRSNGL